MNAKEFLSRGINLQRHVETIREQIEHYKCLLNNCTATYSDMPKSTDLNYKLEECTQKIMDSLRITFQEILKVIPVGNYIILKVFQTFIKVKIS